jgi:hypothetical protein
VRESVDAWACNPKVHVINAQKGHKRTAKKATKKDKGVAETQANTEANVEGDEVTTGSLKTEIKPGLTQQE